MGRPQQLVHITAAQHQRLMHVTAAHGQRGVQECKECAAECKEVQQSAKGVPGVQAGCKECARGVPGVYRSASVYLKCTGVQTGHNGEYLKWHSASARNVQGNPSKSLSSDLPEYVHWAVKLLFNSKVPCSHTTPITLFTHQAEHPDRTTCRLQPECRSCEDLQVSHTLARCHVYSIVELVYNGSDCG